MRERKIKINSHVKSTKYHSKNTILQSIAAHSDHFVRRLSVSLSDCLSGSHTFLVVTHSYVSQATHAFLAIGMLLLCFINELCLKPYNFYFVGCFFATSFPVLQDYLQRSNKCLVQFAICRVMFYQTFPVFSSPEPTAQVSYCHSAPSVVVRP